MNKRGDKVLSIYWFFILFIVAGGITYMVYTFYGSPYDVRMVESTALSNQIANCITNKGYLNDSVFNQNFSKNFLSDCHLNFNVENVYNWKNQAQYYAEIGIYKFDPDSFNLLGGRLVDVSAGNINLKTTWQLSTIQESQSHPAFSSLKNIFSRGQRKVTTIVIHTTDGATARGAIETIADRGLSVHYMIDRNGNIFSSQNPPSKFSNAFVSPRYVASHAGCGIGANRISSCSQNCVDSNGLLDAKCQNLNNPPKSEWCCIPSFNPQSIGIELVNLGPLCSSKEYTDSVFCKDAVSVGGYKWENFSQSQLNSLVNLVAEISSKYNIPVDRDHIIGHYQITTYKTDPGPAFPWDEFLKKVNARKGISGSVQQGSANKNLPQGQQRSFYAIDKNGNQYIVQVLAIVGKIEKNA